MEEKFERTCTREEMADTLEKLAAQLRSGSTEIEQQVRQVPGNLEMKLHVKEKKGRVRYKVEWNWSSLEDYDEAARGQLLEQRQSFKQIKKNLALAFKQLKRALPENVSPDDAVVREFVVSTRAFVALAEPEWRQPAEEFMGHLENLLRALESSQRESVLHELTDLENRMVACHREFR
jgi:XXXCH domain-containing protein